MNYSYSLQFIFIQSSEILIKWNSFIWKYTSWTQVMKIDFIMKALTPKWREISFTDAVNDMEKNLKK